MIGFIRNIRYIRHRNKRILLYIYYSHLLGAYRYSQTEKFCRSFRARCRGAEKKMKNKKKKIYPKLGLVLYPDNMSVSYSVFVRRRGASGKEQRHCCERSVRPPWYTVTGYRVRVLTVKR